MLKLVILEDLWIYFYNLLNKRNNMTRSTKSFDIHRTLPNEPLNKEHGFNEDFEFNNLEEKPKKRRRVSWKMRIFLAFLLLLSPFLVIGSMDYQNASAASQKMFGTSNAAGALFPSELATDANGRTNILLIGYSADDPGHAGALLTDSIMVLSLDKTEKSGYMLSVPRDLYVDIPDYGSAKINEAYQAGETQGFSESGYPAGGVGLLEKVVSENFDIKIHNYLIINYGAVRDITDALGGITVTIQSSDPRGLHDPNFKPEEGGPLWLANGQQKIDGQTALRLTRARGSTFGSYGFPQSDFNRTQNQQAVLAAIKAELDWKLILDPRLNEDFFNAVADNVKTDLKLSEVLPLFRTFRAVPDGNLKSINLRDVNGTNYLASYTTRSGQSALIPAAGNGDFNELQALVKSLSK